MSEYCNQNPKLESPHTTIFIMQYVYEYIHDCGGHGVNRQTVMLKNMQEHETAAISVKNSPIGDYQPIQTIF